MDETDIGYRLAQFRQTLTNVNNQVYSQSELAHHLKLGASGQTIISQWESGAKKRKISYEALTILINKFNLNVNWLFSGKGPMTFPSNNDILSLKSNKHYNVFIHYAHEKDIAFYLADLFEYINCNVYLFGELSITDYHLDLKDFIQSIIDNSNCLLSLLSRSYINVLASKANLNKSYNPSTFSYIINSDKPKFYASTSDNFIPPKEFNEFNQNVLNTQENVCNLIKSILISIQPENIEEINAKINTIKLNKKNILKKIVVLAEQRWVFIGGSSKEKGIPKNNNTTSPASIKVNHSFSKNDNEYKKSIEAFTDKLTLKLMNHFSIGSCPAVVGVGQQCIISAISFLQKNIESYQDYTIASTYNLDTVALTAIRADENRLAYLKWQKHIEEFRIRYFKEKCYEYIVFIGGGEGTLHEYEIISKSIKGVNPLHIKIIPIPCFGGTAQQIYFKILDTYPEQCQCKRCLTNEKHDDNYMEEYIDRIFQYMKNTYLP